MIDEERIRRQRLEKLREAGKDPYPSRVERTKTIVEYLDAFDALTKSQERVTLVGRLRTIRRHGGLTFANLEDGSGKVQLAFHKDKVGDESYEFLHATADMGDFLEASGVAFTTKKGERSLDVLEYRIITKSLLPLPEKWHGLQDVEQRFRKRYLDLIMNEEARLRLRLRSRIIASIRETMDRHCFLEVETPTLQPVYGGGFARPFKTHHHALDADFYLRISDEMYLKRLLVGGVERVYEITKVFRNEGLDRDHNPEFTMFEAQAAYKDYQWGMDLFEEIFETAAKNVLGTTSVKHEDVTIELKRPWKRMRVVEAIKELAGIDVKKWKTAAEAKKALTAQMSAKGGSASGGKNHPKIKELDRMKTVGEMIAFAFEELVEEKLVQPTIIYDYPIEVSPLAKKCKDPNFTERFEVFALGSEIGNNYSELNDPIDLEKRFLEEKKKAEAGFEEAHQTDLDYLDAIKHGMPPACGLGIGVDRMIMLLTGTKNIKEVILFPTLRPEKPENV